MVVLVCLPEGSVATVVGYRMGGAGRLKGRETLRETETLREMETLRGKEHGMSVGSDRGCARRVETHESSTDARGGTSGRAIVGR